MVESQSLAVEPNPYAGFGRIVGGSRLVGRDQVIELLHRRLAQGLGSVAVIGAPRIGKSSLVSEVRARLSKADQQPIVIWIDLSTLPGPRELFEQLTEGLVQGSSERNVTITATTQGDSDAYDLYRLTKRTLETMARAGLTAVAVLDEFDAVRGFERADLTIKQLRDLVYEPERLGLSVAFIARRSLMAIETQVTNVSTLDGVCEPFWIGLVDRAAIDRMSQRSEIWRPDLAGCDLLWEYSGGHPYIADMILCRAWEGRSMTIGINESLVSIYDFYHNLEQLLRDDGLFEQLLQACVGPAWSLKPGALEHLRRYQLVIKGAEGNDVGWSRHFQAYLERRSREGGDWPLWRQTEQAVRQLIADTLARKFGVDWLSMLGRRHTPLATLISRWEDGRDKEIRHFGPTASTDLLDYSYPMELWGIIKLEWPLFDEILNTRSRGPRYWSERFELLSMVRTPRAHNRDGTIPNHYITLATGYCEELLDAIRGPHGNGIAQSADQAPTGDTKSDEVGPQPGA